MNETTCTFRTIDETHAVCTRCGLRVQTRNADALRIRCRAGDGTFLSRELKKDSGDRNVPTPSLIQKATHYAHAVTTHLVTGRETRTDAETAEILAICEKCNALGGSESSRYCTVCGCRLSVSPSAFSNKIRMKTQHCPKGNW